MAADTSSNEPEAAMPAAEDPPSAVREPFGGPMRPPRPAKRPSGAVRIPLPSAIAARPKLNGAARAEIMAKPEPPAVSSPPSSAPAVITSHVPSSAPAVATTDAPAALSVEDLDSGTPTPVPVAYSAPTRPPPAIVLPALASDPAGNIEFALTRRSSAAPALSFDSTDVDPSARAPAAPLTPWRDVPPLEVPPGAERPLPRDAKDGPDHEATMVGQVAKDLLALSSEDEGENTRAYQAPQELIELARRQREERRQARAELEQSVRPELVGPTLPVATLPSGDAAPPVDRSQPAPDKAPPKVAMRARQPSLTELAREISDRRAPEAPPADTELGRDELRESVVPPPEDEKPWLTRGRVWALIISGIIVLGFALARWRGLDLLRLR